MSEDRGEQSALTLANILLDRAAARMEWQLGDSDTLDFKALGLLALDAAALTILVAVHDSLHELWWTSGALFGVAALFLFATVWPLTFDLGPDVDEFHREMAGAPPVIASEQMLSELVRAIETNDRMVERKARHLRAGFCLLLVAIAAALAFALIGPWG